MKEQFKEKLNNAPELIDTIEMQLYALQHFMGILGFYPRDIDGFFNEGQYGFKKIQQLPGLRFYKSQEVFLSFEDAVSMYNNNMTYKSFAGLYQIQSKKGDNTISFDPQVLRKADKLRIFDRIGLQWAKKKRKILSTKTMLKFN